MRPWAVARVIAAIMVSAGCAQGRAASLTSRRCRPPCGLMRL